MQAKNATTTCTTDWGLTTLLENLAFLGLNYAIFGLKPLSLVATLIIYTRALTWCQNSHFLPAEGAYWPLVSGYKATCMSDDIILIIASSGSSKQTVFCGRM